MAPPPLPCVYRVWDDDGRLIYVGATSQPIIRFDFHRRHSWWFKLAARIEPDWHPTRESAFAAERVAIQEEQPAFNVADTGRGPQDFSHLTKRDLDTFRTWLRSEQRGSNNFPSGLSAYVFELDEAKQPA